MERAVKESFKTFKRLMIDYFSKLNKSKLTKDGNVDSLCKNMVMVRGTSKTLVAPTGRCPHPYLAGSQPAHW